MTKDEYIEALWEGFEFAENHAKICHTGDWAAAEDALHAHIAALPEDPPATHDPRDELLRRAREFLNDLLFEVEWSQNRDLAALVRDLNGTR